MKPVEMGEVHRDQRNSPLNSPTNGLTSEVLRARAVEYYHNYLPQTPRPTQNRHNTNTSFPLRKSGSVTRLNLPPTSSTKAPVPPGQGSLENGVHEKETSKERKGAGGSKSKNANNGDFYRYRYREYSSPHPRGEKPHRTHSERSTNRLFNPALVLTPRDGHGVLTTSAAGPSSAKLGLYRSNSSLDLDHEEAADERLQALKREYGSASSLDVIGGVPTSGDSFFAMLKKFQSPMQNHLDQRSPGPAKMSEYLRGPIDPTPMTQNASNALTHGTTEGLEDSQSPKMKNKLQRLWEIKDKGGKVKTRLIGSGNGSEPSSSIFRKLRGNKSDSVNITMEYRCGGSDNSLDAENRLEEKLRKKAFAHYDVQSLMANLGMASKLRDILRERRNTTTGASAASSLGRTHSGSLEANMENLNSVGDQSDQGDGRSNDLLLSCRCFRNELGGEEERLISLNKLTVKRQRFLDESSKNVIPLHRPPMACGLSILEKANAAKWKQRPCPYQRPSQTVETVDLGALYYRKYFFEQEHQNWFGVDETLGPLAISIKREKTEETTSTSNSISSGSNNANNSNVSHSLYRVIIRTSELNVMRGSVLEEAIPSLSRINSLRGIHAKEVLEYVAPEMQLSCLRLGQTNSDEKLLKLDEQRFTNTYKVGIMYCKANQTTEEEMYNNEYPGPALEEFLDMLGKRVRLKGFNKYKAGLDNRTDTTGLYSIYSTYNDCEVMFHVSTMLPFTPNNTQQLLRKRHIGNDIVTIVFQEPDSLPFTPKCIRSQFQHVFLIVRAINPCTDSTKYSIAVSRSKDVPIFGPAIPEGAIFNKSKAFADFILAKAINAENEAHYSEKFTLMAQRTRQEYLKDLAENYVSSTTIESGPKFSILSFGGRKKERPRLRFIPDTYVHGAIAWNVLVEDFGQSCAVDCVLGISTDTFVLIEENTKEIIFVCPCTGIIGWSSNTNSLKIFYHQGECVVLHTKDPDVDEVQEIVSRLAHVTTGCESQELILRRNSLGQLGFHVQYEGVVTEVESYGFAFQAGLRQGSRLVEICKVAASTLSYDQMVDLLKTSMTVTVTVVPPFQDGQPRKGCSLQHCSYLSSNSVGGDYENVINHDEKRLSKTSRGSNSSHGQKTQKGSGGSSYAGANGVSVKDSAKNFENPSIRTNNASKDGRNPLNGIEKPKNRFMHGNGNRNTGKENSIAQNAPNPSNGTRETVSSAINRIQGSVSYSNQVDSGIIVRPTMMQSRSSPSTPYSHLGATTPTATPPLLHHNHTHHRSFHDHHNVMARKLSRNRQENNMGFVMPLTHFGGMVASRSELSLNEITPLLASHNGGGSSSPRSHFHNQGQTNNEAIDMISTRSPSSERSYGSGRASAIASGKVQTSWSPMIIYQPVKDKVIEQQHQPKSLPSSVSQANYSDYYSDSSSEWHPGRSSADELSLGECSLTPPRHNLMVKHSLSSRHRDERGDNFTSSGTPEPIRGTTPKQEVIRPHPTTSASTQKQSAVRLRTTTGGIGSNSNGTGPLRGSKASYVAAASSASSCSGSSSSTLQEDLLKLISPDFINSDGSNSDERLGSQLELDSGDSTNHTRSSTPATPCSSLGRSESGGTGSDLTLASPRKSSITSSSSNNAPIILTKAQPAQVISSSEPNSPTPAIENLLSREERLSPRVTSDRFLNKILQQTPASLSLANQAQASIADRSPNDWMTMVDTATKAMSIGLRLSKPPWLDELAEHLKVEISKSNGQPNQQIAELQKKVRLLQQGLITEQNQKSNLEIEIDQLRQENQRLQEESQSASAQLRKFTQWFLQSMDS